jgi:hypothetical protein
MLKKAILKAMTTIPIQLAKQEPKVIQTNSLKTLSTAPRLRTRCSHK